MNTANEDTVKQEIWETVCALNDAWTKGNPDELSNYFHPNMVIITPNSKHRIEGACACIADWKPFAEKTKIHSWKEIDPVIHVYDQAAVISYYYEIVYELSDQLTKSEGRTMFFFVKENDKWLAVAYQFSPCP